MKSFRSLFLVYWLVINSVALIYLYATSLESADALMLLSERIKYLVFTGLGGGGGALVYYYSARPPHLSFAFLLILWGFVLYQLALGFWFRGLFYRKKKDAKILTS